ncbi:cytotoxic domain-containing protein [Haemophilus parainfluenzae]|uniref:Cytotoxic domain-containing protein n=1 Tax=Haemophilus parainfluenzae TaxID=729 RepID=A0A377JFI4_HAEPA|nr:VENN motif pre-toxin domain-containing protein [Haemophilus parainfluenzae]STP02794.1 cytotoxic domain-containing protein [Haemophilus parainfluenzae]
MASGLSPAVNNQIKKATTDAKGNVNTALNLTAHALWGAVEAYAGNRNVAAGAAGAAGGEVAAHFLASTLYNKSPEKLSEEEKRTVSSLSQVAAGIAGGTLSDSSDGAIIAAKTAKDAVENNALTQGDIHSAYQRLLNGEDIEVVLRDLEHLSQKQRDKLLADCDAACRQVVPSLLMAANDFSEEQAIAIGSILSKIPADQRSRVDMLVQSENSKTLEAIENSKSDVEKHIALAVKVMRFFQAENAVSGGKPNKPKATSVHSENKDYSKDVANLGVKNAKFNSELNNKVTQNERYVVAPKLIIDNKKYNYLFGNVKSAPHNTPRALQNQQQLASIGIYNDKNGREIINKSLNEALSIRNSVINTYSKNADGKYQRFEAIEGIIAGPFGIRKVESHFEIMNDGSRRLTTIIFKGGN